MTPKPQEGAPTTHEVANGPKHLGDMLKPLPNPDRVVISGMAGLYPDAYNVQDLSNILYNKINPVTSADLRYKFNHPEVNQYTGSVPDLNRFDAQFFKVHYRLAMTMDPMGRKVLEQAYQAIYDAGVNPDELSGKKVGVYVGSCFSEAEKACFYEASSRSGFGIAGCSKTMFANRISYWLNAKGPSMAIDDACCSSTVALEQAYLAMSRGECESALVCGTYLCLHPQSSLHYGRIIKLCPDGKTKSFDENADGCAKSETINVLFLQKAKNAVRIYADVMHAKTEYTCVLKGKTGPLYGFCRSLNSTTDFIKKFYEEADVPPQAIEYMEAFGCAVPEADKVELQAFEEVLCKDRADTLLVGSVISNIGYAEASAGISAITKVLLGYHTGVLAANMHYSQPRRDVAALCDGRMRVLDEHQPFRRTFAAVNGMSVTGVNSHVLLHGHYKPKDLNRYKSSIPHLVNISGRHEEAVKHALGILKSNPIDAEQIALLHNIHRTNISGHMGRGFVILQEDGEKQTKTLCEKAEYYDDARRPLWFVYSGMGSQWSTMGAQLMRIPIFAAAIERCHNALKPKGLDIVHIITSPDETIFNNILHSFVGIAAVQIGLTDILRELGLKPDGIIGHSVGELGCAYADGCLTAEEMILSAYYRGLVSLETKFIHGSMAAVGLGYDQVSKLVPPEIEVACHNGPESSTISGPSDVMKEFVAELTAKGVFAKEVPCSNIAYHSRYIADAGPGLLKYLKQAIPSPKARSERWVSSSVPQDRWNEPIAKFCSAEYLTNNLLSSVLFEETSRLVPENAVLVEIAPHGLLQAILKRSMNPNCINIPLTKRKHPDNAYLLLEAIGKLYMQGFNSKVEVLYPKVEMPVSTGTPFLSHFVKWEHAEKWPMPLYSSADRKKAACCNFVIALHDKEHAYLEGHSIRGRTLFPYAATLTLAWHTLASIMGVTKEELSVEFTDVQLHAQPVMHDRRQLKLNVTFQRGKGAFEILDGNSEIATGSVKPLPAQKKHYLDEKLEASKTMSLTSEDVYEMFRDRDYYYGGEFRSIECVDETLSEASLVWNNNWVTFIDGLLQMNALRQSHNAVSLPTSIRSLKINVEDHNTSIVNAGKAADKTLLTAIVCEEYDNISCGGVVLESVKFEHLPPVNDKKMTLKPLDEKPPLKTQNKMDQNGALPNIISFGDSELCNEMEMTESNEDGVSVTIHYVGITNKDVKQANDTCVYNKNVELNCGTGFSGITASGERVMGVVRSGAVGAQVRALPQLLWPVPKHWTLEDAATVPLAYVQALYCLAIKSQLCRGYGVFVHGGAGALGQAIIRVALSFGCEVFTTVSDMRKKHFLLKLFPELKADHIGCSRDHSFGDMVLSATKDKGCEIVISCAKGDLKNISMACTAFRGIFLDISQLQSRDNYDLGMSNLSKERNYYSVDFSSLFNSTPKNKENINLISGILSEGIARGFVRPLSRATYSARESARALRLLAASQHRGRVLLHIKHDELPQLQRMTCDADRCHVVLCDRLTFGVQVADRLVARGAKKLYIHTETLSSYLKHKIRSWRKLGVTVVVSSEDLNEQKNVDVLLNNASRVGSVEGIHIIASEENRDSYYKVIRNLDATSRKLCTDIRYFSVVNVGDNSIGKDVCLQRLCDQLPAKMIMLPEIKEGLSDNARSRSALDAVERALQSPHNILLAHTEQEPQPSLLQQIARISGVKIPDTTEKHVTLQELGVQSHMLRFICKFLRLEYNLAFNEEQIMRFTVDTITQLDKMVTEIEYSNETGLSTFFNYVDSDELLATTDIVLLPTLVNSSSMRDDEFHTDQKSLCIVPGLEGHHERFRVLCERLKLPALVLQPGLDHAHETATQTAERFAEVLLKKTGMKESFYLLGYESGVSVALETAAILEEHGLTGTVFCVGCTPEDFQIELEHQLSEFKTEEQLQDGVLRHMYRLMAGGDAAGLESLQRRLRSLGAWEQKADACVRALLGRVSHSAQYARALVEAARGRVAEARRRRAPERRLHSQLVLLRAAATHAPHAPAHAQFAALQQRSRRPLVVHQLRAPLAHAAMDLRCAAIINEHLDSAILESFAKRNACDTYLLNANSFMAVE